MNIYVSVHACQFVGKTITYIISVKISGVSRISHLAGGGGGNKLMEEARVGMRACNRACARECVCVCSCMQVCTHAGVRVCVYMCMKG